MLYYLSVDTYYKSVVYLYFRNSIYLKMVQWTPTFNFCVTFLFFFGIAKKSFLINTINLKALYIYVCIF